MVKFTNPDSFLADEHSYGVTIQETGNICYGSHIVRSPGLPIRLYGTERRYSMPRPRLILPRADAECGKTFFEARRIADEHRIALEFWNRATGHIRKGYHLAVYRCKRCGGFHIGQKRIKRRSIRMDPRGSHHDENGDER